MDHTDTPARETRSSSRGKWVLGGFLLIAAFFLWTEHRAHLLGILPYFLFAACPLMHLFHHGHGHHGADKSESTKLHRDRKAQG